LTNPIYITQADKEKLSKLIEESKYNEAKTNIYLKKLEAEINRAIIKSVAQLPTNIVIMNSNVLLEVDGFEEEATLVYPEHANVLKNKISVLSPLGTAILGYEEGSEIEWEVPNGKIKILVKKVNQI
jgi:regulator of nucleoside diphosphate kinase